MATYDWNLPTTTTNYTTFVSELHNRLNETAKGFPAADSYSNLITGAISFRNGKWQSWNGSTWVDLASSYSINISGTATNITGTLAVGNGGTGITSYTIGDIPYASASNVISKLAAVAVNNVLISKGVATAPAWGKIDLNDHTEATALPVSKGGLGVTAGIIGLVKGTGTSYVAAVSGTDYAAAEHNHDGTYLKLTGGSITGDLSVSGSITSSSDVRLKSDIQTLESALTKVLQLRGVSYTKAGKPEIGVIAQEIELVVPEVVEEVGEYKAVAYGNLVALLIEAIKELDRKVDARTCN